MRANIINKVSITLKIMVIFSLFITTVCAASNPPASGGAAGGVSTSTIDGSLGEILWVLTLIGEAVCLGKCIQIGWMFIVGSIQDKARAKEALLPWIVGAFILFGASWLGPLIINTLGNGFLGRDVLTY
jgi:type IV secretory pathway VirB2 component (pilin)